MISVAPRASANTGGYPYADYNGPGSNPSTYTWTDSSGNEWSPYGYAYRNCTDYVAWKLQSLGVADSKTRGLGNGGQWATKAQGRTGVTVNQSPAYGAAAVNTSAAAPYGHVSFVDEVYSNGTLKISEYNYGTRGNFGTRTGTPSQLGISNFVHFGVRGAAPGVISSGNSFLLNNNFDGSHDILTQYGNDGLEALVGDWNGDNTDNLGVRSGNSFLLNNNFDGSHDILTYYGNSGMEVLVGDWNGDGVDTLGVRNGGTYLLNNNFDGSHDILTYYGGSSDEVFVGDWNGDGVDTLGVRRPL